VDFGRQARFLLERALGGIDEGIAAIDVENCTAPQGGPETRANGQPTVPRLPALTLLTDARASILQLSSLLDRAFGIAARRGDSCIPAGSVGEAISLAVSAVRSMAHEHEVRLSVDIAPAAADLPAGPLTEVIHNGLSNAVDACIAGGARGGFIEVSASISAMGDLVLLISDTGPGVDRSVAVCPSGGSEFDEPGPAGAVAARGVPHDDGLETCRRILKSLGGRVRRMNVPFGVGAVMEAAVPLHRLLGR
jgi:hypothetical protein